MKRLAPVVYLTLVTAPLIGACKAPSATYSPMPSTARGTVDSGSAASSASVAQSDRDAITEAIQKHLSENKGINMRAMDMTVSKVNVTGDQAQADTEFHLKQGGASMVMTYFLERNGGGWLVVRSQQSDAGQFAHSPMDQSHSGVAVPAAGPAATPGDTPTLPDISDFLKDHAPPKSN